MDRVSTLLRGIWLSIRKAHARLLALIYSQYKRRSMPINIGERTVFFESYCPSIQNTCDDYGICVPTLSPKTPNKIVLWFLKWRFGWPWPIRLVSYKGKRLEFIALTPDEMANTMQGILDPENEQRGDIEKKKNTKINTRHTEYHTPMVATIPTNENNRKKVKIDPISIAEADLKNNETIEIINRHFEPGIVEQ